MAMPVTTEDWLMTIGRLAVVIGLTAGAYQGWKRAREEKKRKSLNPDGPTPPIDKETSEN